MSEWVTQQAIEIPGALNSLLEGNELLARALVRRGIKNAEAARAFLDPAYYRPTPARELPDIDKACGRLLRAIEQHERICVWGDFDVDGQTATTILVSALRELEADVCFYIPVRARESHGVHLPRLGQLIDEGVQVVLTCDTGIAAHEAVAYAQTQGIDFLITDHHELPPTLPPAYSITNPQMLPEEHPLRTLPGVGVAYKLVEQLLSLSGKANRAEQFVDLVALGIVADVAMLKGDTRYLLQCGLRALSQPDRIGLLALMDVAGLNPLHITEEHIGFLLAPRLNALGRLGDANSIVELLTTKDESLAKIRALELEGLNAQRQLETNQVFRAAQEQITRDPGLLEKPILVLANPNWPAGILGIVASRLVDQYHLPTILISTPSNQPSRGSARSVEGIHITQAIAAHADLLITYGGHAMAAGLAILPENITAFYDRLCKTVASQIGSITPEIKLRIDATITLPEITRSLVDSLEQLAPYGPGNPPLIFTTHNLSLHAKRNIGRNAEHMLITVQDEAENRQEVIWWQSTGWLLPEGRFDLAYTLHASNYRGQPGIQVQWIEAKELAVPPVELISQNEKLIIEDFRAIPFPQAQIRLLQEEPDVIIWSEAETAAKPTGVDRRKLTPRPTLVIWTIPPSRDELIAVLRSVKPTTVVLFAQNPGMDQINTFIERLAGLAKFALNQRQGITNLSALAAAMAHREATIIAGLDWLQAKGMISYQLEDESKLILSMGKLQNTEHIITAEKRLTSYLCETAAFRSFYKRADAEHLLVENKGEKQDS